jgi:hypothetical protein
MFSTGVLPRRRASKASRTQMPDRGERVSLPATDLTYVRDVDSSAGRVIRDATGRHGAKPDLHTNAAEFGATHPTLSHR